MRAGKLHLLQNFKSAGSLLDSPIPAQSNPFLWLTMYWWVLTSQGTSIPDLKHKVLCLACSFPYHNSHCCSRSHLPVSSVSGRPKPNPPFLVRAQRFLLLPLQDRSVAGSLLFQPPCLTGCVATPKAFITTFNLPPHSDTFRAPATPWPSLLGQGSQVSWPSVSWYVPGEHGTHWLCSPL